MMNIKGIFAVSLIAMVAMVAGVHTSNAVAAIASQGYVDQQVGSKLSSISGSTTGSGNVVTSVSVSGSAVSATKGITAEETKNKVTSTNYDANVSSDTKYPTVKAVADAIADVEKKIPAAITVDSALSSTSTNPVQNKVINTALAGKQATLTSTQLNAVNSGITSTKVSTYDGYNEKITAAQSAADDAAAAAAAAQSTASAAQTAANAKVATAQGTDNANDVMVVNSSGNVAPALITNANISSSAAIAQSKISGLTDALAGKLSTTGTAARATADASGNNIVNTYATKSQITALDSTSSGTGAVVTAVSQTDGKVSVTKGNVQIPFGGQNATSYVSIWVE